MYTIIVLRFLTIALHLRAGSTESFPYVLRSWASLFARETTSQYLMVFGGCGAGPGGAGTCEDGGDTVYLLSLEPNVQVPYHLENKYAFPIFTLGACSASLSTPEGIIIIPGG